jgi:hypothetical protein
MFRNTRQNFRRTYLAAGLGAFLAYCVWMLSESINSDEPVDLEYMMLLTLGGVGMFLLPYSQMSILSWLAVKELESRIRIVNPTSITNATRKLPGSLQIKYFKTLFEIVRISD